VLACGSENQDKVLAEGRGRTKGMDCGPKQCLLSEPVGPTRVTVRAAGGGTAAGEALVFGRGDAETRELPNSIHLSR
jgi:hypothetical protein